MADDAHQRYSTGDGAERSSLTRSSYLAYLEAEAPSVASEHLYHFSALHRSSRDHLGRDIAPFRYRSYVLDDEYGSTLCDESGLRSVGTGVNIRSCVSSFEDPNLVSQIPDVSALINAGSIPDVSALINPAIPEPAYERHSSLQRNDGLSNSAKESSMLFVDGLPRDCTRREVGHLFRPFFGFKDIRVVHKEPRRTGDKAMVLCFVEFDSPSCARIAKDALQGYKFDDKMEDSPVLKIHFTHFPFKHPSAYDHC